MIWTFTVIGIPVFLAAREIMTNQFLCVFMCMMFADLMTHAALKPELSTCLAGYRTLLQLQPCPLKFMNAVCLRVCETSNVSARYPGLGRDEASKKPFDELPVRSVNLSTELAKSEIAPGLRNVTKTISVLSDLVDNFCPGATLILRFPILFSPLILVRRPRNPNC